LQVSGVLITKEKEMKIKILAIAVVAAVMAIGLLAAGCGSKSGNLKVSVTDSSGNELWGAKVVSETQPEGQLKIDGITSQEAGGVVFNGIKSGTYRLQVSRYGFAPETVEVTVKGGQTESVTVKLFYASPPPIT
jgi:hypothetical protein